MLKKTVFLLFFFSSVYARDLVVKQEVQKNKENVSLAGILLKAKQTDNLRKKKKLLEKSFNIKPTLYAVKTLLSLNRNDKKKCLRLIEYSSKVFPLNKFINLKGAEYSLSLRNFNKAEYFIFSYLKVYPFDRNMLYMLGRYYEIKGKTFNAAQVYTTIYKLYGDEKALYKLYGDEKAFKKKKNLENIF